MAATFVVSAQDKYAIIKDTTDSNSITKKNIQIEEVQVRARLKSINLLSGSTGIQLDMESMQQLPRLVGEADPYKALQYMGGVSQAGEANSGLYVRGGNNDQNLILLNGTLIQNPTHVLGIFSVFNPDLIDQMKFVKSGIPAEYGGRLSSVVDISTASVIPEKLKIDGSLGLISSRICVQFPVTKKFSVYGSLRGSYISSLILPGLSLLGIDSSLTKNRYEYYDVNAGFNYKINSKHRIIGHFYSGNDDIGIMQVRQYNLDKNSLWWKNTTGGIQHIYYINNQLSFKQQLSYSSFEIESDLNWFNSVNNLHSGFNQYDYNAGFIQISGIHQLRYGTEISYNQSHPNFIRSDSIIPIEIDNKHNNYYALQGSAYFRDELTIGKWQVNAGVRGNIYAQIGPYTDYDDDQTIKYSAGSIIKTYHSIEPRFFARYLIHKNTSVKLSASRIHQYLNQVPVFSFGIPADLQIPASLYIKPQASWHFSGGYFQNFKENSWETSVEAYYKTLENQLEFKSNVADIFTNGDIEKNLLTGHGWSYGIEFKVRKNSGKFTGWFAYNLAWSYRQFDAINDGKPFLASNDRRHDLSIVTMYKLNDKWNFSALFVYATGSRLNLPLSWYVINQKVILEYGDYNAFEMPAYHRLDLSAIYKMKTIHGIRSELNFSVYNAYNRANPFQILYSTKGFNGTDNFNVGIRMSYLLPVIPSVSWVFHI